MIPLSEVEWISSGAWKLIRAAEINAVEIQRFVAAHKWGHTEEIARRYYNNKRQDCSVVSLDQRVEKGRKRRGRGLNEVGTRRCARKRIKERLEAPAKKVLLPCLSHVLD